MANTTKKNFFKKFADKVKEQGLKILFSLLGEGLIELGQMIKDSTKEDNEINE